jgi:hypothetical protein
MPRLVTLSVVLPLLIGCSGKTAALPATDSGNTEVPEAATSEGSSPEGGAPTVTADQAASDVASAYCALAEACAPAYVTIAYGDVTTCEAAFKSSILEGVGANGTTETPAQLEACADALPMASCGNLLGRNAPAACQTIPGTLADGAPCASDSQCSGARCRVPDDQLCGTCMELAAAGAPCTADDDCDHAMACVAGACVAYGAEGASCGSTLPCRPDLGCQSGTCAALSPAGTPCSASTACDALNGVVCNPVSMLCETAAFAAPGAPCELVNGNIVLCSGPAALCGGVNAPTYEGTCVAPAANGSPCDTVNGPLCGSGSVCVCATTSDAGCTGVCTVPDPSQCH